jgi:hypothetical protein
MRSARSRNRAGDRARRRLSGNQSAIVPQARHPLEATRARASHRLGSPRLPAAFVPCASSASMPTASAPPPPRDSSLVRAAGQADIAVPAGNQGAGSTSSAMPVPPDGYQAWFRDASTKKGYSGVAIYSRREPDEIRTALGLGAVRRRRPLHRGALRQSQRGLVLHSVRQSGDLRQGFKFQVMAWLKPILDQWLASGRDYVLCGDWNIVRAKNDIRNWTQPEELRLPAGRTRLAQRVDCRRAWRWIAATRARLARRFRVVKPGCGRVHVVVASRRRARQQRGLAHRLPGDASAAACPSWQSPRRPWRRDCVMWGSIWPASA